MRRIVILSMILFFTVIFASNSFGQVLIQNDAGNLIPSASFLGLHYVERIGYALDGGGDVNGDGYDDFLIGTFHNAVVGYDAGAVYLILGRPRLDIGLNTSLSNADARFLGGSSYDAAGYSVACNGDLNGDGLDDMLIGAPAGNDSKPRWPGKVYVVFGDSSASWGNYFYLANSRDSYFEGENGQDLAGLSVAYVGDLDEDGYDDFLCGAPFNDDFGEDAGKAYLVMGHGGSWNDRYYLAYSMASFYFDRDDAKVGYSVAGIGDINNDGSPDLAIGSLGTSRIFVLYGRTSPNWGSNFNLRNADLTLYGRDRGSDEGIGWRVAPGGDINGDGIDDVLISAIHNNQSGDLSGKVYVLFGKDGGWAESEFSLENGDASYIGEAATDYAGWGLSTAGDVDMDGFDDFLIGAWYNDHNGPDAGKAYLIKGKSEGWQKDVRLRDVDNFFVGERDTNYVGFAVSPAGDFDGDGYADYVISAPYNSEVQQWSGEVYLFASQRIPYYISGKVNYFLSNETIPGAFVHSISDSSVHAISDWNGNYSLEVPGQSTHQIFISKENSQHVGSSISSYDAALIARFAVNLNLPDSVNTEAADVNLDAQVNMYDAANALRYAVELPPLPGSHAGEWHFMPESMTYYSVDNDTNDQDYEGYIVGDVDVSWVQPDSGLKKYSLITMQVSEKIVEPDQEFSIPIAIPDNIDLLSFDLKMNYDSEALEFIGLKKSSLTEHFSIEINDHKRNQLICGGFSITGQTINDKCLELVFRAKRNFSGATHINFEKLLFNDRSLRVNSFEIKTSQVSELPDHFLLKQNYPNPLNNFTTIPFHIAKKGNVQIEIFNTLGRTVKELVDEELSPGSYQLQWDGKDEYGNQMGSGVYICKAIFPTGTQHVKVIFMK